MELIQPVIFQNAINEQVRDIQGVINISDDIIVFGETQEKHNEALEAVLRRLLSVGLTVNKEKCEFNKKSLEFFGFVFSRKGISPDPRKVKTIHEAKPPSSTTKVRSFIVMATYCAKFIPNFSDITKPLRELTKKNVNFKWTEKERESFEQVKQMVTSDTVMAYFDGTKQTELTTDASPWGLSAILSQKTPGTDDRRIVAYVSRSLSATEQKYSQTEKEALAIVWAIKRLHIYLFGGHFTLVTDCKPLQFIFENRKSKASARIERWNMLLQEYDFSVGHIKGEKNPSDYLSRHPSQNVTEDEVQVAEEYVKFISINAVPKAMSLADIQKATKEDKTLQRLAQSVRSGKWDFSGEVNAKELKLFHKVHDELTIHSDSNIILRGTRIVIPSALRKRAMELAHEGHQGLVKTKQLIREKVWFPGIDKEVKQVIDYCTPCQANTSSLCPSPLQMSELPPEPWHTVHVDFCGPFPTGEYLLVAIDVYSRFPVVEIVQMTSAKSTIVKLEKIFCTHGIPRILKSDNGLPFNSQDFKVFMQEYGINHRRVTPLWPQANSEAENFMKPLSKVIKSAHVMKNDWKKEVNVFLLNYRATPHLTTNEPPSKLLFNRVINTKLPELVKQQDHPVRKRDKEKKVHMKEDADRRRAKVLELKVDDVVLMKQRKINKYSTTFDPVPFKVVRVKGSMITVTRNGKYLTRNKSMLKKVKVSGNVTDDEDSDYDIEDDRDKQESDEQDRNEQDRDGNESRYPVRNRKRVQRYGQNIYDY